MIAALAAVVVAVVIIAAGVVAMRTRRPPDTMRSFQRQIDALSPESRRNVVDQVHHLERDPGGGSPNASIDDPVDGSGRDVTDDVKESDGGS